MAVEQGTLDVGNPPIPVTDNSGSLTIDADSLPLPTGAATAANQATEIASLAAIDAGIPTALGQATMAASMPVVLASNQTSIPVTTEGLKQTYAACVSGFIPPAAATDVFTITGSATKIVRITLIRVSCTTSAGSGISINAALIKRSTADSAGTSTTMTDVPHDSTNGAGTAVIKAYTANPTLGTAVGNVRTSRFQINSAGTTSNELAYELGTRPAQTLVLRGVAEQLCVNFGGASITNPICSVSVEWTEE